MQLAKNEQKIVLGILCLIEALLLLLLRLACGARCYITCYDEVLHGNLNKCKN